MSLWLMRINSISGKLLHMQGASPAVWRRFITGWLMRKGTGIVPCIVPGSDQLLHVPLRDFYDSYQFFCEKRAGICEIRFFLNNIVADDVIYDIGAFRGAYFVTAKMRFGAKLQIHAFEPVSENLCAIRQICELNGFENVTLVPLAAGVESIMKGNIQGSMFRVEDRPEAAVETELPAVAIDEYVADGNSAPSVMKIDVEGFEFHVLEGARACLQRHRPQIWMEIHPEPLKTQRKSAEEVIGFLREIGYQISFFDDYGRDPTLPYHLWCS